MTNEKEFNASSVQEAVERAASEFGVYANDLKYEILDQGSEGFLGIGARDVRILASISEPVDNIASAPPSEESAHPPAEPEHFADSPGDGTTEDSEDELNIPDDDSSSGDESKVPEEELEEIKTITESFVSAMGFQSRIDVYETEDAIAADIVSDHTALLIGQKGETLDSLQHLVNCAAHQQRTLTKRVALDSEGYRQRRIEAIQGMAHRAARRAMREGQSAGLPPMPPTERRIVHVYLENDENVTTYSEGSGDHRKVVVAPADQ